MSIVPLEVVVGLCLHGQGKQQCRYLGADAFKTERFYCLKTMQEKRLIDDEVAAWQNTRLAEKRQDEEHTTPLGDNCPGFSVLSVKEQFMKEVAAMEQAQSVEIGEG